MACKTNQTPSSRYSFFPGLCTSGGKQANSHLPFKIKVSPHHKPLSDGKKTSQLQPILIKNLLPNLEKGKDVNSTVLSASTQKKKQVKRTFQPFLNTQSCGKVNSTNENSTFFQRNSVKNVRRQLYQDNLDSSRSSQEDKNLVKRITSNTKLDNQKAAGRKSFLLPPNSIRDGHVKKSNSNKVITPGLNKLNSLPNKTNPSKKCSEQTATKKLDCGTMTSPPSKTDVCSNCYNIVSNKFPYIAQNVKLDDVTENNTFLETKLFLERSIETTTKQLVQLQSLYATLIENFKPQKEKKTIYKQHEAHDNKENVANANESNRLEKLSKVLKEKPICDTQVEKVQQKLASPIKIYIEESECTKMNNLEASLEGARLSTIGEVSIEIDELQKDVKKHETKGTAENSILTNAFLAPESPKALKTPKHGKTPKTPRSLRRRSLRLEEKRKQASSKLGCSSEQLDGINSLSDEDSFITLEKSLKVERSGFPTPLATVIPFSNTPGTVKYWDKTIEAPLKEYMALKLNSDFLVTPDVKRFQSLENTETPHSRKSLSRKIFMELCDLYAESPEHA